MPILIFSSNVSDNAYPLGQSNGSWGDARECDTVAVVSKKMPAKFAGEGDVADVAVDVGCSGPVADIAVGGNCVDGTKKIRGGCL